MKNSKLLLNKAHDLANEITNHNIISKALNTNTQISKEHIDNNKAVRDILLQRGVRPKLYHLPKM